MRIADNWQDYKIIDTSDGDKLESWGGKTLVRPDPQIIWKTPRKTDLWEKADAVYHRSSKGGGEWEYRKRLPENWNISYGDLKFIIRPTGFKHTGLFPEQAVNWDFMADKIRSAGREIKVLNLFAYTGGATLAVDILKANASASSVRIHRRSDSRLRQCWSAGFPCRRFKRYGSVGEGKRRGKRTFG